MPSRNFSGTFDPLRDDKLRRTVSEDNSQYETTRSTTLQSLRPQHTYGLDEDDRGRVRSGSLLALVERLTSEPDFISVFSFTLFPASTNQVFQRNQKPGLSPTSSL